MIEVAQSSFQPARFETAAALLIAGLSQRYSPATASTIPALWQRLVPYMDKVPQRVGAADYGICYDSDGDGNFNYLCGFEVTELSSLPTGFSHLCIPPQQYAVSLLAATGRATPQPVDMCDAYAEALDHGRAGLARWIVIRESKRPRAVP
jgi:hypothetical protein